MTRDRIEIETTFECFEPGAVVTIAWTYGDAEIELVLNPADAGGQDGSPL
jgi:hypothetical protein